MKLHQRIKLRLLVWCWYLPKQRFITWKWNRKCRNHKPRFKKGDLVEFSLSYATVVYSVQDVLTNDRGIKSYELKGLRILDDDGTNQFKTEAKRYSPYCASFDKTAKEVQDV